MIRCDKKSKDLRDRLLAEYRTKKAKQSKPKIAFTSRRSGSYSITFPGAILYSGIDGYGADHSSIPLDFARKIQAAGTESKVKQFDSPVELDAAIDIPDGVSFTSSNSIVLDIRIALPCGQLSIGNVKLWVVDQQMSAVLLGSPLLQHIGLDLEKILTKLCDEVDELDTSGADEDEPAKGKNTLEAATEGIRHDNYNVDPIKETDEATANMGEDSNLEILEAIQNVLNRARAEGMSVSGACDAEEILLSYRNVLSIKLGNDPPADVEPYLAELKSGAQPYRAIVRRYPPAQTAFINSTVR